MQPLMSPDRGDPGLVECQLRGQVAHPWREGDKGRAARPRCGHMLTAESSPQHPSKRLDGPEQGLGTTLK